MSNDKTPIAQVMELVEKVMKLQAEAALEYLKQTSEAIGYPKDEEEK